MEIIITVPHSYCPKKYMKNIGKVHFCDVRSRDFAECLNKSFTKYDINAHIFLNNDTLRFCVKGDNALCGDLNRKTSHDNEWTKSVMSKIYELKNKKIILLDVHSYPNIGSFGGSDMSIIVNTDINKKANNMTIGMNLKINKILSKSNSYCNLHRGKGNYLIDKARDLGANCVLLEIIEDKNRLNNDTMIEVCNGIVEYVTNNMLIKQYYLSK